MSEYQYYEFQAVDRPLSQKQMEALRAISTRADITPSSFTNEYNFGDFKGNPFRFMQMYFDGFVYFANWGSRTLMLRVPRKLLDSKVVSLYCESKKNESFSIQVSTEFIIFSFNSEDDNGKWEDPPSLLSMIPIREELMTGDLRCLYLGWLLRLQSGELDDDRVEPPVPAGLDQLSPALKSFMKFLRIDQQLLKTASVLSEDLAKNPILSQKELKRKIEALSVAEKNRFLLELVLEKKPHSRFELLQELQKKNITAGQSTKTRRFVKELKTAWLF